MIIQDCETDCFKQSSIVAPLDAVLGEKNVNNQAAWLMRKFFFDPVILIVNCDSFFVIYLS